MALELTSTALQEGESIPQQYTADGRNVSPPLTWRDPPAGTRSLALICEDPDAPRGTFTHWVIFNMPAESRELSEGIPADATLPNGTAQGTNDFKKVGYGGPSPLPASRIAISSSSTPSTGPWTCSRVRPRTNCLPPRRATSWARPTSWELMRAKDN